MIDYSQTKIFSINNDVNDKKFVSFTTKRLCEMFSNIRQKYKRGKFSNDPLMVAMKEIGVEHFTIKLEEECECKNIDEVNNKVYEYIQKYDSINNGYNSKRIHKRTIALEHKNDDDTSVEDEIVYENENCVAILTPANALQEAVFFFQQHQHLVPDILEVLHSMLQSKKYILSDTFSKEKLKYEEVNTHFMSLVAPHFLDTHQLRVLLFKES
jgi:hypothetical protein